MTRMTGGVTPRSKIEVRMPPGAGIPRADVHEQAGPQGGVRTADLRESGPNPASPAAPESSEWNIIRSHSSKEA